MRVVLGIALVLACIAYTARSVPARASAFERAFEHVREFFSKQSPGASDDTPGGLKQVSRFIKTVGVPGQGAVLGASVSEEGHWSFVSRDGQAFTAATGTELADVVTNLAPLTQEAGGPVVVYLTATSVFLHQQYLTGLASRFSLRIVVGAKSYPLRVYARGGKRRWFVQVRPQLLVGTTDLVRFRETVWQLNRSLAADGVRVLAFEGGGPQTFARWAPLDPKTRRAAVDRIDPVHLVRALPTLAGQTAIITGRIEDSASLVYRTARGGERKLDYSDVRGAAERADVNLIVLNASAPRQPGMRTWLWLNVEVEGLQEALQRTSLADFLNSLGQGQSYLLADARARSDRRTALTIVPIADGEPRPSPGTIGSALAEVVSEVVGTVVPHAIDGDVTRSSYQEELDRRVVPGVPSDYQLPAGVLFILGILASRVTWGWWQHVWPIEAREEYTSRFGLWAAIGMRLMSFCVIFLPLTAIPGFGVLLWQVIRWLAGARGAGRHSAAGP